MNTTTQTKTQAVILEMLLHNTGTHMLDSGGDHGRAWQRNQVAGVEGITEAPAVTFEYGSPVLSVYHFLTEHLEYAPMLDAAYSVWDDTHPDEGWLDTVESFLDTFAVGQNGGFYESGRFTLNTYEMEYCYLSQVLQFTKFDLAGVDYVALQIHGGADVRGGYTKPRIFQVRDFEGFFLGMESASVKCLNCNLELKFCVDSLEIETGNMENEEHVEKMEALDKREIREWFQDYNTANECPNCGESGKIAGA
jgi:hypothetical protein